MSNIRIFILALALLVLLAPNVFSGSRDAMSETFEGVESIRIRTVSGDCEIKTGESDKIEVNLEFSIRPRDSFEPEMRQRGKTLVLEEDFHGSSSGHSYWNLTVPATIDIDFESASGDFEASGLEGDVEVETASGDVAIAQSNGDFELSSASGDIILENVSGFIDVSTASGDVRADNLSGRISLSTASGRVDVQDSKGDFALSSASGDVDAVGITLEDRSSFETASGRVYVELAESAAHDMRLSSASGKATLNYNGNPIEGYFEFIAKANRRGRISAPFDFDKEDEFYRWGDEYVAKSFTRGGDNPEILLETASGRVYLEEQ